MLLRVKSFLLLQAVYHLLVVGLSYGADFLSQSYLAILRDGIWILLVAAFLFLHWRNLKKLFQARKKEFLLFGGLVIFAVLMSRFFAERGLSDLLIGFKYGLWYRGIFLMAGTLWYLALQKMKKSDFSSFLASLSTFLRWSLPMIVMLGWILQFTKLLFPDFFHSFGYGGLDDFHFGKNPPMYYLTGFEGTLRWQGLFAGPNNYGYFLVAFLPVILRLFPFSLEKIKKGKKADWRSLLIWILRFISIAATLSRAALVGVFIVLLWHWRSFLLKFKKVLFSLLWGMVVLVWVLSVWKRDSTLVHIEKKLQGFEQALKAPLGYGLGSSWPAVHHQGKFLPENYYVQLLLDLGVFGFGIWLMMLVFAWIEQRKVLALLQAQSEANEPEKNRNTVVNFKRNSNCPQAVVNTSYSNVCFAVVNTSYSNCPQAVVHTSYSKSDFSFLLSAFQEGFLALLVMGLFLHVFEDSMVNYRFFVSYGLVFGMAKFLVAQAPKNAK